MSGTTGCTFSARSATRSRATARTCRLCARRSRRIPGRYCRCSKTPIQRYGSRRIRGGRTSGRTLARQTLRCRAAPHERPGTTTPWLSRPPGPNNRVDSAPIHLGGLAGPRHGARIPAVPRRRRHCGVPSSRCRSVPSACCIAHGAPRLGRACAGRRAGVALRRSPIRATCPLIRELADRRAGMAQRPRLPAAQPLGRLPTAHLTRAGNAKQAATTGRPPGREQDFGRAARLKHGSATARKGAVPARVAQFPPAAARARDACPQAWAIAVPVSCKGSTLSAASRRNAARGDDRRCPRPVSGHVGSRAVLAAPWPRGRRGAAAGGGVRRRVAGCGSGRRAAGGSGRRAAGGSGRRAAGGSGRRASGSGRQVRGWQMLRRGLRSTST
jgi:hypothetical protein